jgi:hypothetical protein
MLIQADASQLEWRTAVELSHDEVGLAEILNKDDTHSLNEKAFKLPSRLIAKIYLFRTIFRGSGWAFANDPEFMHVSSSAKYWDNVNEQFYKKYHGLDKKHHEWADLVVKGRPIIGPLGRFWPVEMTRDYRGELKLPWTILTNYPVQGTGADVMTVARISFLNRLRKLGLDKVVLLVSSVHDSIVVDAPSHLLDTITNLFHQVFDDLQANIRKLFKYEWQVPLACEVKYGPNMKQMQKHLRSDL